MNKISIVYSTFANKGDAKTALNKVIAEGLAVCGNILSEHTAVYKWNGEIVEEKEVICIFKTTIELTEKLIIKLHEIHPYEVPCILTWRADGLPDYIKFLKQ